MAKRLFINAKISEPVREELRRVEEKLKRENQRIKITWVNPEVMHLTLHFLGDCLEEQIEEVKQAMTRAVGNGLVPFRNQGDGMAPGRSLPKLTLVSLDAFPNPREPRVIIIHTQDEGGRLAELQKRLGQELAKIGFAIDPRPFRTHITLGRVKVQSGRLQGLDLPVAPVSWQVGSVELMESQLTSQGPTYSQLLSAEFN